MARPAFVTIGQAPRDDILAAMFAGRAPSNATQAGALDDCSPGDIAALRPRPGEHPLVSRLRTGEEVVLAEERLLPLVQAAVDRAVAAGADMVVVLCTGEFAGLTSPVPVIYPDRILIGTVNAVFPTGRLGVLMPHPGQEEWMRSRWAAPGRQFIGGAVSPYGADGELAQEARRLAGAGAGLIVLDCMGFDGAMRRVVAEAAGVPVVQANRLVGRVVEELVGA